MKIAAFRLEPGADLRQSLLTYCAAHQVDAGCIVSCVGSLQHAVIRFADQPDGTDIAGKLEIISLAGTVAQGGCHLHIAVSDAAGRIIGGHLLDGSIVYTTAEVVLGILPDLLFKRETDATTGHKELRVITQ